MVLLVKKKPRGKKPEKRHADDPHKLLKALAGDSSRVFFLPHATMRMKERNITQSQVFRCLKRGYIIEGPAKEINGNWRMVLETCSAGDRIRVVAEIEEDKNGNLLIVVTVMHA
jgi:hypothetical protein